MKNKDLRRMAIFVVSSIILFSALSAGSEETIYKNQGSILEIDVGKNTMIVNERRFAWNQSTAFYDSNGSLTGMDRFKRKSWVYIEGTVRGNNVVLIEKIYLLPKYVGKKEKNRYPFME